MVAGAWYISVMNSAAAIETLRRSEQALKPGTEITISYYLSKVEEHLPQDIGAALIVRIRDAKNEQVLLDRN